MIPTKVLLKNTTVSTMEDARDAVRRGFGHGTVCRAERQEAGRGRLPGRRWENSPSALLFTVVLAKDTIGVPYPATQLVALALCRRLERCHGLRPLVKWPNDVLVDGAKAAGILVETEGRFLLAGIGINLASPPSAAAYRTPVIGLEELVGKRIDPVEEMLGLLEELEDCIRRSPSIDEIRSRLGNLGETVEVLLGDPARNERRRGSIRGLNDDGALLVDGGEEGTFSVYSGEIDFS